jgi:hypothetical protein
MATRPIYRAGDVMKTLSLAILFGALAFSSQGAMAEMMRCSSSVIDDEKLVPVTAAQVLAACGEPASRENGQWVYQQQGQPPRVLQFDTEGNLQSISEQSAGD